MNIEQARFNMIEQQIRPWDVHDPQVLALLAEIQERRNLAVLFITHDLRVAAQICDEVMVMQRGRVVEDGPAAEVLASPRHDYTRALINAAPGRDWDFAAGRRIAGADA